jgi:shikimate dehydrogenase
MSATVRLAVLGDPLRHTRSPELHRAGAEAVGLACDSVAVRTPVTELRGTLARLAAEGYRGCNLTMPLKEPALDCVRSASEPARRARSVNTVTFRPEGSHGDTTDGAGFVDLVRSLGRDPATLRVVLLGAGGAARSLAHALASAGAGVLLTSRREPSPGTWAGAPGASWSGWSTPVARRCVQSADVVVNATPLGAPELESVLEDVREGALVVDLTYGQALTPWVMAARARGLDAFDGLGLLVHQARHSLSIWFGREVPFAPLAAAVGWPR